MNLIKLSTVFFLTFFLFSNGYAAGSPVDEDFSLVISLSDDMVIMAKKGNKTGFIELADAALKLSEAMRRTNSMPIERFRPKLRAAKKAGSSGDFDKAILILEEAKTLMRPVAATWDGGS